MRIMLTCFPVTFYEKFFSQKNFYYMIADAYFTF